MTTRVCVVGSVNLDTVLTVAALPKPGETVLASSIRSVPGGKGGNQAVAAARAGARVQFVGAVGDDPAAEQLRAHLSRNQVGTDALITVPGPSGAATIMVEDSGQNAIIVAAGANAALATSAPAVAAVIADCDVLLMQLEIPVATAVAAARIGHDAGATVMVNVSPAGADPTALEQLSRVTDVVLVNEVEIHDWHWPARHLVVTLGPDGASYTGPDGGKVAIPTLDVKPVDTSGAGDAFTGVLAADWPTGPLRAIRRANAAGALATQVPGAGDSAPSAAAIDEALARDGGSADSI